MAKRKSKTYTTSELADKFNISVVSASRFIVKHNFTPVKTGNHNAKYYSEAVYQQMKKHYQNKPKTTIKQSHTVTKDDIIEQLKNRINEQSATIELLKEQLTVKDKQIATANRIADQAQQLDLTTHKQQKIPEQISNEHTASNKHGFWWRVTH